MNHTIFETQMLTSTRYGGYASMSKSLFKQKMNLGLNLSYNRNQQTGKNSNIYNGGLNVSYRLAKKQSLNLNAFTLATCGPEAFTEIRVSFGYRIGF